MIPSADKQPNDRFGYSCYALVITAPEDLVEKVNEIRKAAEMTRAAIPAHITVKGTFFGIRSLEEVKRQVQEIAVQTDSFFISFEGAESSWWERGGALAVPVSPRLQTVHDALVTTITPLGTTAYRDDPYRAHMTYVQDVSEEGLKKTKEMVAETDFGTGFQARYIDLWARIGQAEDGSWVRLDRFRLIG